MVDVAAKDVTHRIAIAAGRITCSPIRRSLPTSRSSDTESPSEGRLTCAWPAGLVSPSNTAATALSTMP
jgi:hypothetical protein